MDLYRLDDHYRPTHHTSRSRSPTRSHHRNDRSRSPPHRRHHHHHHHHRSSHHDPRPAAPIALPYNSPPLQRHDLNAYEALFAEYLDVQKGLDIHALDRDEVKGRWKSFLGKWNRGVLAEGWYDPSYRQRCEERYAGDAGKKRASPRRNVEGYAQTVVRREGRDAGREEQEDEEEEDGYGPALPGVVAGRNQGPAMPKLQDLQERRERLDEDYEARRADLRYERKQERQTQRDRLDEIVPRAEAGTRERQIEKKREVAASNRAFKDAKEAGDVEVADGELMGDGGVDGYKAEKKKREKVKNEREIRKEEVLRARAEEREGRMAEMRGKEEKTMEMLRGLAKARFG